MPSEAQMMLRHLVTILIFVSSQLIENLTEDVLNSDSKNAITGLMASLLLCARVVVDSKAWFDGTEVRGAESESQKLLALQL